MTEPGPDATRVREVAPGVIEVFLPLPSKPSIVNVFLIALGGDRWALVDTGTGREESRAALDAALASLGIEPEALTDLLATHHHPDHFGASAWLAARGTRIHLSALERTRVAYALSASAEDMVVHGRRHGMPIPAQPPANAPSPMDIWAASFQPATEPDHLPEDGCVLELGTRRIQAIWTPGHTPGHLCWLDLESRILFVGDHLLPKITPHVGVFATSPPNPLGDFLASQEKVAALDVSLVCPAHGGVYPDHRHRAAQLVAHHEHRLRVMADLLRAGPQSAFEVTRQVFAWVFEDGVNRFQIGAAVMETIAHLELLAVRGAVPRTLGEDGVVRFG